MNTYISLYSKKREERLLWITKGSALGVSGTGKVVRDSVLQERLAMIAHGNLKDTLPEIQNIIDTDEVMRLY